jgi:uncharacterized protein YjbI with pentapeptide repeats
LADGLPAAPTPAAAPATTPPTPPKATVACSPLTLAGISGAELCGADRVLVDLRHAGLPGANLIDARLMGVDMGHRSNYQTAPQGWSSIISRDRTLDYRIPIPIPGKIYRTCFAGGLRSPANFCWCQ